MLLFFHLRQKRGRREEVRVMRNNGDKKGKGFWSRNAKIPAKKENVATKERSTKHKRINGRRKVTGNEERRLPTLETSRERECLPRCSRVFTRSWRTLSITSSMSSYHSSMKKYHHNGNWRKEREWSKIKKKGEQGDRWGKNRREIENNWPFGSSVMMIWRTVSMYSSIIFTTTDAVGRLDGSGLTRGSTSLAD